MLQSWKYLQKKVSDSKSKPFLTQPRKQKLMRMIFSTRKYSLLFQKCVLELSGADDYAQAKLYNCWFYSSDAIFYDEGSQLWAFITQAFFYKNAKFLCSLDWKFPEFFKTHPTFICSSFLSASRSLRTQTSVFSGTPCI